MKYFLLSTLLFIGTNGVSQRLDLFLSKTYVAENMGKAEPLPYTKTISYFDFISAEQLADTAIDDRLYYFIYFLLPGDVSEVGIRAISPVPPNHFSHTGDIETDFYMNMALTAKQQYFDPVLVLESGTTTAEGRFEKEMILGENDNSNEVIPQPNGKRHNSVLRVTEKDLKAGIYRVLIAESEKMKKAEGNYLLQIGCVPGMKGIRISGNLSDLTN